MKPVRFAAEAVQELADAAAWYESRQAGLGAKFLEEVNQAQQAVGTRLHSFPRLAHPATDLQIRRVLLARFPYALVVLELEYDLRILAVAHLKRHPDYWLNRLQPS